MGTAENGAGETRLASVAEWSGYLGVTPLLLCLAAVGLLPDYAGRELAQRVAIAWGAVLLGCAGAVHFGLALAGRLPWQGSLGSQLPPAYLSLRRQLALATCMLLALIMFVSDAAGLG